MLQQQLILQCDEPEYTVSSLQRSITVFEHSWQAEVPPSPVSALATILLLLQSKRITTHLLKGKCFLHLNCDQVYLVLFSSSPLLQHSTLNLNFTVSFAAYLLYAFLNRPYTSAISWNSTNHVSSYFWSKVSYTYLHLAYDFISLLLHHSIYEMYSNPLPSTAVTFLKNTFGKTKADKIKALSEIWC